MIEVVSKDVRDSVMVQEIRGNAGQTPFREPIGEAFWIIKLQACALPAPTVQYNLHGQTTDITNGCIAMIMGDAFEQGKTLMCDHLHRRSEKPRGLKEYPEDVMRCHEAWTRRILEPSQANVIVLCGKKVQVRIMEDPKCKLTILPLLKGAHTDKALLELIISTDETTIAELKAQVEKANHERRAA